MEDSIVIFGHRTFPYHPLVGGYWVCLLANDKKTQDMKDMQIIAFTTSMNTMPH